MKPGARFWPVGPLILVLIAAAAVRLWVAGSLGGSDPARKWYDRGVEASSRGDIPAAATDFERATALNGKFAAAYDLLAGCYLKMGNTEQALETLQHLESLEPDQSYVSTRIAETYSSVDNALTERWATLAIIQAPRSPRAHMLLALALARAGTSKDAVTHALIAENLTHDGALSLLLRQEPSLTSDPARQSLLFQDLVPRVPYQ